MSRRSNGDEITNVLRTMPTHPPDYKCYIHRQCREPACRAEATFRRKKQRVARARHGPGLVDAAPLIPLIHDLKRKGWSYRGMSAAIGVNNHFCGDIVNKKQLLAYRWNFQALVELHRDVMSYTTEPVYPVENLVEYAVKRYGSTKRFGHLYKLSRKPGHKLTAAKADMWAGRVEAHPTEIWPDYYEVA